MTIDQGFKRTEERTDGLTDDGPTDEWTHAAFAKDQWYQVPTCPRAHVLRAGEK